MNDRQSRIVDLLEEETSVLTELHELLIDEASALKKRDTDSTNKITQQKNDKLNLLADLDQRRQQFIEASDNQEITNSETIAGLNKTIQEWLQKCKHQNNINGGMIEISQLFNANILDILNGSDERDTTYSASGKNKVQNTSHCIARI